MSEQRGINPASVKYSPIILSERDPCSTNENTGPIALFSVKERQNKTSVIFTPWGNVGLGLVFGKNGTDIASEKEYLVCPGIPETIN